MSDATIKKVLSLIEKEHNLTIQQLGSVTWPKIERIPSGSLGLDLALGGGWPRGRVVEIFGQESTGKSLMSLIAIAKAQQAGGQAAFIDAEHALSYELAQNFGVDVGKLYTAQPDSGEQALEAVKELITSNEFDIVVVDSVDGLVPQSTIDGNLEDAQMGVKARMMSKFLQVITPVVGKSKTVLIFINQLRQNLNPYSTPFVTPGGMALKFYSSVRVQVKKLSKSEREDAETKYIVGHSIHAKVVKNKTSVPFREAVIPIVYQQGIVLAEDFVHAAKSKGLIAEGKNGFKYTGKNVPSLEGASWGSMSEIVAWLTDTSSVDNVALLRQEIVQ